MVPLNHTSPERVPAVRSNGAASGHGVGASGTAATRTSPNRASPLRAARCAQRLPAVGHQPELTFAFTAQVWNARRISDCHTSPGMAANAWES